MELSEEIKNLSDEEKKDFVLANITRPDAELIIESITDEEIRVETIKSYAEVRRKKEFETESGYLGQEEDFYNGILTRLGSSLSNDRLRKIIFESFDTRHISDSHIERDIEKLLRTFRDADVIREIIAKNGNVYYECGELVESRLKELELEQQEEYQPDESTEESAKLEDTHEESETDSLDDLQVPDISELHEIEEEVTSEKLTGKLDDLSIEELEAMEQVLETKRQENKQTIDKMQEKLEEEKRRILIGSILAKRKEVEAQNDEIENLEHELEIIKKASQTYGKDEESK